MALFVWKRLDNYYGLLLQEGARPWLSWYYASLYGRGHLLV